MLNRGNAGTKLFRRPADYETFVELLAEAQLHQRMRLLGFCLMPDHWHLLLWPYEDGDLSSYMRWLSNIHVRRYHLGNGRYSGGHIYQGRYRNFPVQKSRCLLGVLRYVESGPLRQGLVKRAQDWRWSSLTRQTAPDGMPLLSELPVERPPDWLARVNRPFTDAELLALRTCVARGRPYGQSGWMQRTIQDLGLEFTVRPRGRPKKAVEA